MRGEQDLARLGLGDLGHLPLVLHDQRARLVLQLLLEPLQQPPRGFFAAQAAELVQRLPLHVEQVGQLFVAAVGVFDLLGQLALVALDHLLLAAQLLDLLLERVLALVEQPFALVQLLAQLGQLALAFGLLLDGHFLDFQLGFLAAIGAFAIGAGDDLAGLRFRRRGGAGDRSA